jgi:hypothetical protein
MRRFAIAAMAVALAIGSTGCIVVLGGWDLPGPAKVVEIDGELYVIDLETQRLHKICDEWLIEEEATTETGSAAEPETDAEQD